MKLLILAITLFSTITWAQSLNTQEMERTIDNIGYTFQLGYAPTDWKFEHIQWDLTNQVNTAKNLVSNKSEPNAYDFHKVVSALFRSTEDYHVGVSFLSTKSSTLPFVVKAAEDEDRYFIAHIDRNKLSAKSLSMNVGDELIEFNGKPVQEEIDFILSETSNGVPLTDKTYAALLLTRRRASRAMTVPSGPVNLTLRPKGAKKNATKTFQMVWEHTPESINLNPGKHAPAGPSLNLFSSHSKVQSIKEVMESKVMALPFWQDQNLDDNKDSADEKAVNLHQIGGRQSFIPNLGEHIWTSEKENHFYAYIYKNKKGKLIGYVRVPHYSSSTKEFLAFKKIIKKFSTITDGLVIDQVNNPGGSVFYLYALTSVLTDKPLYAPKHYINLRPENIKEALDNIKQLKDVKDDKTAKKVLGEDWGGYPVSYQTARYVLDYSQFLLSEWNLGKKLSDPTYLYSAENINPDVSVNYTQPILVLVNSLDFSGGDFFPAILQDNNRVTVMGTRTAGAGGYVEQYKVPNGLGVDSFSMTGSLALRINNKPIENLGVTPDVIYEITAKDLESNYIEYVKAIQSQVNKILK